MEAKKTLRDQLRISIASPPPPTPPNDGGVDGGSSPSPAMVPFFGPKRSRGKENTWVVSLFVVLSVVAFFATIFVNDCPSDPPGDCFFASLGRLSFQPLSENPLIGPSSSTLLKMGALDRNLTLQQHHEWRILTCIWLHGGLVHLVVNLFSIIFIGLRLEQDFGSSRIGIIYIFSASVGSLASSLFVQDIPSVGSSGALFGLLGAMFSIQIQYRKIYSDKLKSLVVLALVVLTNFIVGLMPYIDNFSNIGGFLSGILLGYAILFDPRLVIRDRKKGLFDYGFKSSSNLKQKLDGPVSRIIALGLLTLLVSGGFIAALHGVNANQLCSWCHYINCMPTKLWSCNEQSIPCEAMVSEERLILTCNSNDNFRMYPFANISIGRMIDLCHQICSKD